MSLIRVFARVNAEGKIIIPLNIQRETGMKEGQLVELRVVGTSKKKSLVIAARENAR
jgi:bifunctional DNA-binding transcriptional regulator/antitoxin component of YhaV-PrlF toxin-antitoxin module